MKFSDTDICKGCVFEDGENKSECKIKNEGRDKECPCIECLLKCMCINVCPEYNILINNIRKRKMTYKECENAYNKWERLMSGQIFINDIWEDIIDIEEDAHRGWVCKTSKGIIELSNIEVNHIQFPKLDL